MNIVLVRAAASLVLGGPVDGVRDFDMRYDLSVRHPIGDGLDLDISGGTGADNQNFPSEINVLAPGTPVFTYTDAGAPTPRAVNNFTDEPEGSPSMAPLRGRFWGGSARSWRSPPMRRASGSAIGNTTSGSGPQWKLRSADVILRQGRIQTVGRGKRPAAVEQGRLFDYTNSRYDHVDAKLETAQVSVLAHKR